MAKTKSIKNEFGGFGFTKSAGDWAGRRSCPFCAHFEADGHADTCSLLETLKALRERCAIGACVEMVSGGLDEEEACAIRDHVRQIPLVGAHE